MLLWSGITYAPERNLLQEGGLGWRMFFEVHPPGEIYPAGEGSGHFGYIRGWFTGDG